MRRDLVYASVAGARSEARSGGAQGGQRPLPAVVFLHGEGWRAGTRQQMNHVVDGMARLGYVVVTPTIGWCRARVVRLRSRIARLRYVGYARTPRSTASAPTASASSGSAGVTSPPCSGLTDERDGLEGAGGDAEQSSGVQAVVSFFGAPTSRTRDWPAELEAASHRARSSAGSWRTDPTRTGQASPIGYASARAPPFLFFTAATTSSSRSTSRHAWPADWTGSACPARVIAFEARRSRFQRRGEPEGHAADARLPGHGAAGIARPATPARARAVDTQRAAARRLSVQPPPSTR